MAHWVNYGFTLDGGEGSSDRGDTNAILIDPLFKEAKNNNKESAKKLWQREWDKNATENTTMLLNATADSESIVFISVPGTSRKNQIPVTAASHLSKIVGDKARFINGDMAFLPIHTTMMKSVARGERVFHPRVFEARHSVFTAIKDACPNARFFIVEDLLTTGNSAHSFQRFLEKNGLPIYGVIAMKGKYEPNVPPNLAKKIEKFFKNNNIPVDAQKLSIELTEKEAQTIAFQIADQFRQADTEHQNLFRKLFQTLYDIRVNNNHQVLPEMDRLGTLLTTYLNQTKEVSHEQSPNQTHPNQVRISESSLSEMLKEHSKWPENKPNVDGTTQDGYPSTARRIRCDRKDTESSGNHLFPEYTGLKKLYYSVFQQKKRQERS